MKLIMSMGSEETTSKLGYISEKITMRSFLQVLLLESYRILLLESKSFLEELKKIEMQISIYRDSPITKMI